MYSTKMTISDTTLVLRWQLKELNYLYLVETVICDCISYHMGKNAWERNSYVKWERTDKFALHWCKRFWNFICENQTIFKLSVNYLEHSTY